MQREEEIARRADAVAGAKKAGIRVDQRRRKQAVFQQLLRAVDVGQHKVEQPRALDEAGFELSPIPAASMTKGSRSSSQVRSALSPSPWTL